jgi:hypothetical protein
VGQTEPQGEVIWRGISGDDTIVQFWSPPEITGKMPLTAAAETSY